MPQPVTTRARISGPGFDRHSPRPLGYVPKHQFDIQRRSDQFVIMWLAWFSARPSQ